MYCSSPPVRGRFVLASGVRGRCTLPWRSPIYSEPAVSVRLADRLPQTNQVLLHPRELYSNHIRGTYLVKLVISQTWSVLDLYLNNFTGPIPDSMEKLLKLRFLSLNNSSLSGSIPKSLTAIKFWICQITNCLEKFHQLVAPFSSPPYKPSNPCAITRK
ncbi:somatic embryogenesis receptor kinase 4-like isoform X1 [Miscanthus floridulus]|uniref:somatic embryogenesis receptor kinase 4-like isoform X1 n=1 Tax=Miscanthus floridulus TaxID=154761 RepID=UPI003458AE3C